MKASISTTKDEFSAKKIVIYKNNNYSFKEDEAISNSYKEKKTPDVTSSKIEWKNEDKDNEMVFQVNFANEIYGGATFERGFVQEEIKNVLSTTSSILTANREKFDLDPRGKESRPTPVVIVGQIKDFDDVGLPYGWNDSKWNQEAKSMIKRSDSPNVFNELAIAANSIKKYGDDDEKSVKALFNNALAGFRLAKEVAGNKKCKIKTGLFGAGAFHNSPEFSIAMQHLASRIANVDVEFCGIDLSKRNYIKGIFDRVDQMIDSGMNLNQITNQLIKNWKTANLDNKGWRISKEIPEIIENILTPRSSPAIKKVTKLTKNTLNSDIIKLLDDYRSSGDVTNTLKAQINQIVAQGNTQNREFFTPQIYSGIGAKTNLTYDKTNCQLRLQITEVFDGGIAQKLGMKADETIVIKYQKEEVKDLQEFAHKAICAIRNLSVKDLEISYESNTKSHFNLKEELIKQNSGNLFYNKRIINNLDDVKAINSGSHREHLR